MYANAKIMRKWLKDNGHAVAASGPISKANQDIFYAANPQYSPESREPEREQIRKDVVRKEEEKAGKTPKEIRQREIPVETLHALGYSDKQIRTWMYQNGKGYVLVQNYSQEDLREMIDAHHSGAVSPLTQKELTPEQYAGLRAAKNLQAQMLSKIEEINQLEKITRKYLFQAGAQNYYIDRFRQNLEELRHIVDQGDVSRLGVLDFIQAHLNMYDTVLKDDYKTYVVPKIVQLPAQDVSKRDMEQLVKDSLTPEQIRQHIDKPMSRITKDEWRDLYTKIVIGQVRSAWQDETQAVAEMVNPSEAMGSGAEASVPGGSSASGPPDAGPSDPDNRLRIDMYYPDPLIPSNDVRTLYVSLTA